MPGGRLGVDDRPVPTLDGYDDLLRSNAVDAFVITDTFLGIDIGATSIDVAVTDGRITVGAGSYERTTGCWSTG
mgnify:CR=1 FL=1